MNIFSTDSVLGRFLNLAADIVILNFLWLLCSIPIFTIGASTTALYYTFMKRQRRDEGYSYRNFFLAFRDNFVQSTILWLILLVIGIILGLDLRIGLYAVGSFKPFLIVGSILLLIPFTFILLYIFPVQAKFENSIKDNLKNALLMAVAHLGYTLLLMLFLVTFVVLTLVSRAFLGLFILCGFGLYAYLTSNLFIMIFRKHLPDELEDDAEASGMNKFY